MMFRKRLSNILLTNARYFCSTNARYFSSTYTFGTAEKETHFGFETVKENEKEKKGIILK